MAARAPAGRAASAAARLETCRTDPESFWLAEFVQVEGSFVGNVFVATKVKFDD